MIKTVIIDDEPDAIKSLELICNEYCSNVAIVGTAQLIEDAKRIIDKEKPDLLLLDIDLPRGNGFDLLQRYPKRKSHVILISALFEKYEKLIKKHRIYGCVDKPVDIEELATLIKGIPDN
jgi:two-component system LytT family response regulator